MDKIYSRKRIKLPKINNNKKLSSKTKIKITKIIIILLIAFSTVNYIIRSITPSFNKLCEIQAKSIAIKVSNKKSSEIIKNYKYEDLFTITEDSNQNITSIQSNVISINKIISEIALEIQEELNNTEKEEISIRLGTFTGSKILSGRGPKVTIKISSRGDVETNFKSEFKSVGINQTLHRLYLDVNCKVAILTPFNTIEKEIDNQVILAENIIVGKIPETYYNLEGIEKGDTLNMMN